MKKIILSIALLNMFISFSQNEQKPNFIFIITDDQSFNTIHSLGNEEIYTPNMDRLARNGVTFSHAYNMGGWTSAICNPSRSMLNSGRSVWNTEKNNVKLKKNDAVAIAESWGNIMNRAGYDTYMTGKWHVKAPAEKMFKNVVNERPGMPKDAWKMKTMRLSFKELKKLDSPERNEILPVGYGRPLDENDHSWSPYDTTMGGFWEGGTHWSEVLKDDAIEFINTAEKSETPFFLYLAFNAPHDPRQAPKEYIDMYPLDKISVPKNFLTEHPYNEEMGAGRSQRGECLAPFPRTEYAIKTHLQEYYASISFLDTQLGLILDKIESSEISNNTYIIFTSDHGMAMGQHGLMAKSNLYDHTIRVPLIITGKNIPKNKVLDQDVYYQDVMPTVLELANIPKPEYVFFNSFLDIIENTKTESHYEAIYGGFRKSQRIIRKDDYKLMILPVANKIFLFDLNKDPYEMNNIADLAENREKVIQLFEELIVLQKEMEDELNISNMLEDFKG